MFDFLSTFQVNIFQLQKIYRSKKYLCLTEIYLFLQYATRLSKVSKEKNTLCTQTYTTETTCNITVYPQTLGAKRKCTLDLSVELGFSKRARTSK